MYVAGVLHTPAHDTVVSTVVPLIQSWTYHPPSLLVEPNPQASLQSLRHYCVQLSPDLISRFTPNIQPVAKASEIYSVDVEWPRMRSQRVLFIDSARRVPNWVMYSFQRPHAIFLPLVVIPENPTTTPRVKMPYYLRLCDYDILCRWRVSADLLQLADCYSLQCKPIQRCNCEPRLSEISLGRSGPLWVYPYLSNPSY